MESKNNEGLLLRTALGRNAFIGELYDLRTESLSSRSLLKSSLPSNFIQKMDINRTELQYKLIENASDRFDLLNVEAEVQVSILCGLISVNGSGKYLTDERKSQKTVSMSLVCKFQTVCEKIFSSFDEIIPYVDLSALKDPQFTHAVFEINWGANCLLTLEMTQSSGKDEKKLEGKLKASLEKIGSLLNARTGGGIENGNSSVIDYNNINVKVSADVIPKEGLPTTVEKFEDFLLKIPTLLKDVNGGKGKPLNYMMVPLSSIRKLTGVECLVDNLVKVIDESFLLSLVWLFEEISVLKQQLFDFLEEMKEYWKYVKEENFKITKEKLENLKLSESDLKLLIANDWFSVRMGKIPLRQLLKKVEEFKNKTLQLLTYEDYLTSCSSIKYKVKTVKNFIAAGAYYLGRGERLFDLFGEFVSFEFIVLIISSEMEKEDHELYNNTCSYFLTLLKDKKAKTKYLVLDLDVNYKDFTTDKQIFSSKNTALCVSIKDGVILSPDLYDDYLTERDSNLVRLKQDLEPEHVCHKPGNRVSIEMTCPAFGTGSCIPDKLKWICFNCKSTVEYDLKKYFYCLCGRRPSTDYEFRCGHVTHGNIFVSPKHEFLEIQLSALRPYKELNILILGQSGTGKSTWINSIINYMSYDSQKHAEENGVICEIPISFTMYSKNKKWTIEVGCNRGDEVTSVGQSGTQACRSYTFLWNDRFVRLIDTPGLVDTRGIQQDKENMQNIIEHIGIFKELHGICILLKANETRISSVFSYCLSELLVHLHKSAVKNIVFCFTNARISFYTPGQTSALLEKVLDGMGLSSELVLGEHNMFCLDNEPFLFLCSLNHPKISHDSDVVISYAKSWDVSQKETRRLFDTVKDFRPHQLKETLSLVTARSRILSLTKPIAEISKTIQLNLAAIERKKNDIKTSEENIAELVKKLTFTEIELVPVPLDKPRTVCTSSKCVVYHKYKTVDINGIEYSTHCHTECNVSNVTPKTTNNLLLKECSAMSRDGLCKVCGCDWFAHMHITFAQKRVEKNVVNKSVESDLMKEKSDAEKIKAFVLQLEEKTNKYKEEQKIILETSVKFGMFLKENAISVYNDRVEDYLGYLILEEENKPYKSESEEKFLNSMKDMLEHYRKEVLILEKVVNTSGEEYKQLTVQEIFQLEQKLYNLELCGQDIKNNVEMSRKSASKAQYSEEVPVGIKRSSKAKNEKNKSVSGSLHEIREFVRKKLFDEKKWKTTSTT